MSVIAKMGYNGRLLVPRIPMDTWMDSRVSELGMENLRRGILI
jgi:hypothetical protein